MADATQVVDTIQGQQPEESAVNQNSLHVTTENIDYRTYGSLNEKGEPDKEVVRRQSADGETWKELESKGLVKLVENTFTWYTLQSEDGFAELVPDAEQRVAIINKGLNAIQTATANQTMVKWDKESASYVTNGETIDLREAINEPINRRNMTPVQKVASQLKALSVDQRTQLMQMLQAQLAQLQQS